MPNVTEATIINAKSIEEDVLNLRIPMIPNDSLSKFNHLQFSMHLAFVMAIKKLKGSRYFSHISLQAYKS